MRSKVQWVIAAIGLEKLLDRLPRQLSCGQRLQPIVQESRKSQSDRHPPAG